MKAIHLFILLIASLAVFASVYSTDKPAPVFQQSRNEILLRNIGHELLKSAGDDTSRVLPIRQISNAEFEIRFENALTLLPDSIISIVNRSIALSTFPANYTVNVIDCAGKDILYGYAKSSFANDDVTACTGRILPKGCYYLQFYFNENNNNNATNKYWLAALVAGAFVSSAAFVLYKRKKKALIVDKEVEVEEEALPVATTNIIQIGKFGFNHQQHFIEIEEVKTTLTNKESKLLYIFSAAINEMIDRNTLQKEVWENEGVIVTRSLDMFVSKLRKKLEADPKVSIVNFPGKGYMLQVVS